MEAAASGFEAVLQQNPDYFDALAQLAYCKRVEDSKDPLLDRIRAALAIADANSRELLHYALAKSLEDSGSYSEAFAELRSANQLGRQRQGEYGAESFDALVDQVCSELSNSHSVEPVSDQPLIFICGMFRSGSTLLEQMLTSHPDLTAGGESRFFQRRASVPGSLDLPGESLSELGQSYLEELARFSDDVSVVTSKRPDNILHASLLLKMFPHARFLITERELKDNCLSVYAQPFADGQRFDTDMDDIAHQYRGISRLADTLVQNFPNQVLRVSYEELVENPEATLRTALDFLGLPWDDAVLRFHERNNPVRTASLWQVRQPLYQQSVGRWQRFASEPEFS